MRHLNCFISRRLRVNCHRYRCLNCGRSFVERLPGILPYRCTSEPLRLAICQSLPSGIPASILATKEGIGDATVERIDEHTLHKKERYVTTLCEQADLWNPSTGRSCVV